MHNGAVNYNKRNCTERHLFLCKQEIVQKYFPNIQYIISTENIANPPLTHEISQATETFSYMSLSTRGDITSYVKYTVNVPSLKSNVNETTIAGACIAGIVAFTFVGFLVACLLKRRRLHCLQAKQQQANRHHGSNNANYDDIVVTSQRQDDNHTYTTLTYDKQAK